MKFGSCTLSQFCTPHISQFWQRTSIHSSVSNYYTIFLCGWIVVSEFTFVVCRVNIEIPSCPHFPLTNANEFVFYYFCLFALAYLIPWAREKKNLYIRHSIWEASFGAVCVSWRMIKFTGSGHALANKPDIFRNSPIKSNSFYSQLFNRSLARSVCSFLRRGKKETFLNCENTCLLDK